MNNEDELLLDFCQGGRFSPEDAREFNRLCQDIIPEYHDFLAQLCADNTLGEAGWWLGVTCRNTFRSRLYVDFCRLAYVRASILKGRPLTVIRVDSSALATVLVKLFAHLNILAPKIEIISSNRFPTWVTPLLSVLNVIYRFANAGIAAWLTSTKTPSSSTPLTLLDTFAFPQYFNKQGEYLDRHYPGFEEFLSPQEKATVRFVPTILGARFPWQFFRMIRAMRRGSFLLPWDYYHLKDYFDAVVGSFTAHRCLQRIPLWQSVDVSPLIRAELQAGMGGVDLASAILYFRLPQRLREQNVTVRLLVDWWENQVIDRALVMGFRKAYPQVDMIGYQGYLASDRYFCVDPAAFEEQGGTLPPILAVGSPLLIKQRREHFGPLSISVESAPLLRNSGVWREVRHAPNPAFLTLFLPLPLDIIACRDIVALAAKSVTRLNDTSIRWWLKLHPSHRRENVFNAVPLAGKPPFILVDGQFDDLAEQADIVFSSTSGSCLEAMAKGCAVIIVGNSNGLTFNPIPSLIPEDGWRLCFDTDDVIEAVADFRPFVEPVFRQERAKQVLEGCFAPVTREGVRHLFRFD